MSCKKDKETTPAVPDCLLTKEDNGNDPSVFIYDAKSNIVKVTDDIGFESFTLEYDSNNHLVKILSYNTITLKRTIVIEYNSQGFWSKVTTTDTGSSSSKVTTAEYDSNGNRIKILAPDNTFEFEYAGGNLIKRTRKPNSGSTQIYTYEYYTDKENKLKDFEELLSIGYEGTPSKYLLKTETYLGTNTNYTYELNAKGFPTKKSQSSTFDRNKDGKITSADDNVTTYEYQCK
ncbi:MAG: hypothetical protein V4714_06355 [Bacteroidota bacterium]